MHNKRHEGVVVTGGIGPGFDTILTAEALAFVADLNREFRPRIAARLEARGERQARIDAGEMPDFLESTRAIRDGDWRVAEPPADLLDRRVEIVTPAETSGIVAGLESGARVCVADCEDSLAPTWQNVIGAQLDLRDAVTRRIRPDADGDAPDRRTATLAMRPRGLHLEEKHVHVDGGPAAAALVDVGLYLFHNAAELERLGSGPYFCLPKIESHLEARLWTDVFRHAEAAGVVAAGRIRAAALIETVLAAFEADEILYELRDYAVGLNCGRRDYIASFIKTFNRYPEFVLPDRHEVTMTTHFLRAYSQLVIHTCHRRGVHAIGGMAAQVPPDDDPRATNAIMTKLRADKEREAADGHDGTWVAHPGLVPLATEVFDAHVPGPDQRHRLRDDVHVTAADLLQVVKGKITEEGLRDNIRVAIRYLAAWFDGNGCVPINHLLEDAATAEIARAQIWQWVHHETGILDEGRNVTYGYFKALLREEMAGLREQVGDDAFGRGGYRRAARLLDDITKREGFVPFVTVEAYGQID